MSKTSCHINKRGEGDFSDATLVQGDDQGLGQVISIPTSSILSFPCNQPATCLGSLLLVIAHIHHHQIHQDHQDISGKKKFGHVVIAVSDQDFW